MNTKKNGISPEQFKGKKILLAEDNEINAEIAQAILTEAGFKVTCAADGAICVDIYNRRKSDAMMSF